MLISQAHLCLIHQLLVPSMWFWSVSWSTNCPVFFSFFLVDQKKNCPVSGNLWSVSGNFWSTKFLFGVPKFLFSIPKNQSLTKKNSETDQKFPETEQIFFWSTKKSEKQTGQLVDQETDQNHMDGTIIYGCPRTQDAGSSLRENSFLEGGLCRSYQWSPKVLAKMIRRSACLLEQDCPTSLLARPPRTAAHCPSSKLGSRAYSDVQT